MRILRRHKSLRILACIGLLTVALHYLFLLKNASSNRRAATLSDPVSSSKGLEPLIFVGGYPRSGTTLMRVLLDVHPKVRCGPETRILPRILHLSKQIVGKPEMVRLADAGITRDTIDAAFLQFIRAIIFRSGPPAERYCVKDPFLDSVMGFLFEIFPNSKFILMIRDGRAVAHSIVSRNVSISGVSWKDPKTMLSVWNSHYERVYENCARAGPDRCMAVRYEQLVLRPRESMKKVLEFLNLPWDEIVLNHEKNVDDLVLVKKEKSTNQVVYPIYMNALTDWANDQTIMTPELLSEMADLSMLRKFGYSELGMPPNYGTPEPEVLKKSAELQKSVDFKRLFHEPV
nr:unnamed protein product [Spirometra erinaceieuropaei]